LLKIDKFWGFSVYSQVLCHDLLEVNLAAANIGFSIGEIALKPLKLIKPLKPFIPLKPNPHP